MGFSDKGRNLNGIGIPIPIHKILFGAIGPIIHDAVFIRQHTCDHGCMGRIGKRWKNSLNI
jgi:hypothetical protein